MPYANDFLLRAKDLRVRAEEVLAQVRDHAGRGARRVMFEIAERYEKLAQRLEQESNWTKA